MGLIKRIIRVIKANLNSVMENAENPEKMLSQLIIDMNQQLIDAKKSVASSIADEKKLERQMKNNQNLAREWEDKARLAVKAGKDDLAKEALVRKQEYDEIYLQYKEQWKAQHEAVENLKKVLKQLQRKIEDAKRKKTILVTRAKRANTERRIQQTISNIDDTSAFEVFDKMSEKVDRLEAVNEATLELSKTVENNDLENQFASLEDDTKSPDLLLEDLKKSMRETGEIEDKT